MKHIKLYEEFVNESVNENLASDKRQIKQTVKQYNAKKVGETLISLHHQPKHKKQ